MSAWEAFSGPFNYGATPLGPFGISVIAHAKPSNRLLWSFRGREGWSVGVLLEHYRCQRYIPKDSRSLSISDTIKFYHQHITQPSVTTKDRVLHGIQQLTSALQGKSSSTSADQIAAIQSLQDALGKWSGNLTLENQEPPAPPPLPNRRNGLSAELQQNSSHFQGWSLGLQGCSRLLRQCRRQLQGCQGSSQLYCLSPKLYCLTPNLLLSEFAHAKCPVCRNLPRHHLNPWRIAPAHVRPGLSQFTLPKRPNESTQRNFWHCGARRYPIWQKC